MAYNKKVLEAMKEELLTWCDTPEESRHEMERYRKEFKTMAGYNIYAYGNIRPYYYQMRAFFEENGMKVSENNSVMQKVFEKYICLAVDQILDGGK